MKKHLIILPLFALLALTGCNTNKKSSSKKADTSGQEQNQDHNSDGHQTTGDNNQNQGDDDHNQGDDDHNQGDNNQDEDHGNNHDDNQQDDDPSDPNKNLAYYTGSDENLKGKHILPGIDWQTVLIDKPTNTPENIETSTDGHIVRKEDEMYEYMPTGYTFIYGNKNSAWSTITPSFYAYHPELDQNGGLKFDQQGKGFQTNMFKHSGKKLEIHFHISGFNACSKPKVTAKTWGFCYFYNSNGKLLTQFTKEFGDGDIRVADVGKDYKFYVGDSNSEIAYFEFRIAANPYYGTQYYNLGINKISICSWQYELK